MKDLIKIENTTIGDESVPTVNARELHEFLESKQEFANWIKKRIEKYEFVENQDYIRFHKKMEANNATMVEYHISLDMAKELAMVENNAKGRQARRYFIECSNKADLILQTLSYLLYLRGSAYVTDSLIVANMLNKHHYHILRDIEAEIKALEETSDLKAPQKSILLAGFVKDTYLTSQNKELPRYILSEEAALQVLLKYSSEKSLNIQYKQSGQWLLYHEYAKEGYTQSSTYITELGTSKLNTKWTQKGRLFIYDVLKDKGILPICERVA